MNSAATTFGPILLAPGVSRRHVACYLFAAGVSIGLFTYLVSLSPYILTVNLGIPEAEQGRLMGNLQFLQEIVVILSISWWGAMSDRFGRRAIYIISWLIMMVAYLTYSFATSVPQLMVFRVIYAIAIAASTTNLSAILADYPQDQSRGKFTGMAFILNGLGAVAFFAGLNQLPDIFQKNGIDELWAGRYAFLFAAGVCFVASIVMIGLKPGRPEGVKPKTPVTQLISEALKAARNKRIGLAYFGAFAARADMIIITLFLVLWVMKAGTAAGLSTGEAQARAGMFVGICSLMAVIWAPVFGIIADKLNRLTVMIVGFGLAAIGYTWVGLLPDVTSFAATIPALIFVGIGQSSTALASTVLLGQEAPMEYRGSVFGMQNFFGALGILAISSGGGYLFDLVGPGTPFIAIGSANALVLVFGILLWRRERG
jgi:MFS family permease